jgi:molecular chaperone GrpE
MSDEERSDADTALDDDAIELDTDDAGELDAAMREALEAIEHVDDRPVDTEAPSQLPADAEELDPVAALRRELAAERERSLRALADLENYRKRIQRERQDEHRFRAFEPMRELLSVVDNLERALAAGGAADDLKLGVEMTLRQLEDVLRRHGVESVPASGVRFDPAHHEAVSRLEDPDVEAPTVVEELQRGYRLHDRLLRPARVVVAVPPDEV